MKSSAKNYILIAALVAGAITPLRAETTLFEEVSGLIRSNLVGASAEEIDRLAAEGLIKELAPRVALVAAPDEAAQAAAPGGVLTFRIYRETVGYIRLGRLVDGTEQQLREKYDQLLSTNQLSGLVLDLRKAEGQDYAAAQGVADLFLADETPLLNWGEGLKRSVTKDDAIGLPVAVLINHRTGGSAEALAAILRQTGVALLIGTPTEGTAGIQQTFPLSQGGFLRVTVSRILLGDAQPLTAEGLQPDIEVKASRAGEEESVAQAGTEAAPGIDNGETPETNALPARNRMNEADLVRHWRGEMLSENDFLRSTDGDTGESGDPVLLRALDLMEGLSILRSWER